MNVELRNIEFRRVEAGLRRAFYLMGVGFGFSIDYFRFYIYYFGVMPFGTLDKLGTGRAGSLAMWFLVDKLGDTGLDDWEVEIADFVPSTAKPATRQVFC